MWRLFCLLTLLFLLAACASAPSETPASSPVAETATVGKEAEVLERETFRQECDSLIDEIEAQGVQNADVLRVM